MFAALDIGSLGDLEDYSLELDDMFDYALHANDQGKEKASATLARKICDHVRCGAIQPAKSGSSNDRQ
jgi:hypothetical protein